MITIYEVARLAGVSKSTVSRVLNSSGYVSESVRNRVEKVIRENNYTPSAAAVSLSRRETNAIGVVIPQFDNTFFGEVLKGISEISDANDYTIICCDTASDIYKEERALTMLQQQRVCGLIVAPVHDRPNIEDSNRLLECFKGLGIPIVIVDRYLDHIELDGVYYENFQSGYIAASELIKAGNKSIGVITGDLRLRIARDRYRGVEQAVKDAGLELNPSFVLNGDFGIKTAYELSHELLKSGVYPDAIITCNNRTSLGFLKAVREYNMEIGKDIAVIGIDRIEVLDILDYKFSCVGRDTHEMGRTAMRLLCERIENESAHRTVHMIPCILDLKGSEKKFK